MLTEGWFHVLVGFVATGFVLLLSGLANFLSSSDAPWKRDYLMSAITAVQGLYVLFYSLEMVMVVRTCDLLICIIMTAIPPRLVVNPKNSLRLCIVLVPVWHAKN